MLALTVTLASDYLVLTAQMVVHVQLSANVELLLKHNQHLLFFQANVHDETTCASDATVLAGFDEQHGTLCLSRCTFERFCV